MYDSQYSTLARALYRIREGDAVAKGEPVRLLDRRRRSAAYQLDLREVERESGAIRHTRLNVQARAGRREEYHTGGGVDECCYRRDLRDGGIQARQQL